MNIKAYLGFLIFPLFFLSCSKNQALFEIDSYLEVTVVAGLPSDKVYGYETTVVFPYNTQLQSFNTADEDIVSINASYGLVYSKFDRETDLSFINEITIDVLNSDDLSDDKETFYFEQFNFNRASEIELFPSLPNIKDYIKNDQLILRVEFIFNTPPPRTFDLAFELQFGAIDAE